jgi:hypothetical protein
LIPRTISFYQRDCTLPEAVSFGFQAQDQLFHARRVLGYSYVYAFYMFGNVMFRDEITPEQNVINQNLFEDQQQQLEAEARSVDLHSDLQRAVLHFLLPVEAQVPGLLEGLLCFWSRLAPWHVQAGVMPCLLRMPMRCVVSCVVSTAAEVHSAHGLWAEKARTHAQVERLSAMLELTPELMEKVEEKMRLQVINSTVNIDKRLIKLYELIENDLLGRLQFSVSYIAPYGVSFPTPLGA